MPEAVGPRSGTTGLGPDLRLLVVGDSSGAGVGVATQDQALLGQTVRRLALDRRVFFRLEARHGSTIPRLVRHLRKQDPERFDVAITAIGVNDITAGRALDDWLRSFADLTTVLRERFSVQRIVISGVPPVGQFPAIPNPLRWYLGRRTRRYDRALKEWATSMEDVTYIDFKTRRGEPLFGVPIREIAASDGFHPGPRIYDEWGRRAALAAAQEPA